MPSVVRVARRQLAGEDEYSRSKRAPSVGLPPSPVCWFTIRPPSGGLRRASQSTPLRPLCVCPRSPFPQGILQHGQLREVHRLVAHGARSSLRLHREPERRRVARPSTARTRRPLLQTHPLPARDAHGDIRLARVACHLRLRSSRPAVRTRGRPSSASDLSGLRTTLSIFRRYGSAICERSSGEPTSFCANSSAVRFMPARTHSMTVEVRMGTTCAGNLEMFRETRAKSRAAPS